MHNFKRKSKNSKNLPMGQGRVISGRNPLRELLKSKPERLIKLFLSKTFEKTTGSNADILRLLEDIDNEKIAYVDARKLDELAGFTSHQGVVGIVEPFENLNLKDLLASTKNKQKALILAVDSVEDPHNLGTILRAAECFGVDGVILPRNRGTSITATVSKSSVGASELVPISLVSNLAQAIELAKDAGFWIVASECSPEAVPLDKVDFPEKTLIIVGSEGEGVQSLILKKSDYRAFIPLYGQIDSLNVSQATAIFLSSYRSRWTGANS